MKTLTKNTGIVMSTRKLNHKLYYNINYNSSVEIAQAIKEPVALLTQLNTTS